MRTQKRIVSLLLTACLLLSLCAALPLVATAEVVSTSGWDGTTATQPEGSGTKDDPYLVSSAENLLWIQKQIPRGDLVKDETATASGGYKQAFAGVYFLQTQDIDLNGKNFASIGYYYANANRMAAFGGTYNGQGFAIRNGKIISQNSGHYQNYNWGHGLFGMIYGATIQNIVLDNVQVEGHGIVGAIVGRAVATSSATDATFNTIENCTVLANCSVTAQYSSETEKKNLESNRAGGIVGMAYATTIRYCTNAASIMVPTDWRATGGITGTIGYFTKVEYCVNTGAISYGTDGSKSTQETSVGGIAGFIFPSYPESGEDISLKGGTVISNCYNSGVLTFKGNMGGAFHLGGILGGITSLITLEGTYPYLIDNCYNSFAFTFAAHTSLGTVTNNFRVAGILGTAWCSGNSDTGTLYIRNSASVDVQENHYAGTNEYRHQTNKTKYGIYPVEPVRDNEGASTVTTKTVEELAPLTAAIDKAITAFNATATAKKVGDLAVQRTTLGTETYSLRFSAQIVGTEYEQAGFRVYASYKVGDTVKVSKVNTVALYS